MKWLCTLLMLCTTFVLNAGVQYNARFGHFIVDKDSNLYITIAEEDFPASTSTLSFIAFSSAGSHSSTVTLEPDTPIDLGRFATGTSLTFWFTSVNPLATPASYNAMQVTNKIRVQQTSKDVAPFFSMENKSLHARIAFAIEDDETYAKRATLNEREFRAQSNSSTSFLKPEL